MGLIYCDTPVGLMKIVDDGEYITQINVADVENEKEAPSKLSDKARSELLEYFAEKRTEFDLPVKLCGTEFQKRVWQALMTVPFGETRTYGDIAAQIGNGKASRAVGMACNRNNIMIIVPCHRIIGANGALTGFGAGIEMKEWLLRHEKAL